MTKPVAYARPSLTKAQASRAQAMRVCALQVPESKRADYEVWAAALYWHQSRLEPLMRVGVDFVFDDEGWVIPFISINGEMTTDLAPPFKAIRRDDLAGLIDARLDPAEVCERWENLEDD